MIEIAGRRSGEIALEIEDAVRRGRLAPGERLPPVRELAAELGVSPATVASAYRVLRERGVLDADGRRGTAVRPRPAVAVPGPAALPEGVRDLARGNPDPALLPDLGAALAGIRPEVRLYGEDPDLPELTGLAARAFEADGIPGGDLAVVSGAMDGIERALGAGCAAGDLVAVEDPGFPAVTDLLAGCGLRAVPVEVDDRGPRPEALAAALARGARALVVTPRAQNPTGAALDGRRRDELAAVLAAHPAALVLEDDFAGPISGAPAETLVRGRRRWAVVRSVSKSLGPDLRVAFLAGDPTTVARVRGRQALGPGWVSHVLQRLVVRLWRDPATYLAVERATRVYAERRAALVEALRRRGVDAAGASGLNVWVPVPDEAEAVSALLAAGWAVAPGSRFRHRTPPAIRVTTAALEPAEAERLAEVLAAVAGGAHAAARRTA